MLLNLLTVLSILQLQITVFSYLEITKNFGELITNDWIYHLLTPPKL